MITLPCLPSAASHTGSPSIEPYSLPATGGGGSLAAQIKKPFNSTGTCWQPSKVVEELAEDLALWTSNLCLSSTPYSLLWWMRRKLASYPQQTRVSCPKHRELAAQPLWGSHHYTFFIRERKRRTQFELNEFRAPKSQASEIGLFFFPSLLS